MTRQTSTTHSHDTGMAAEFYVLCCLFRLGLKPALTFGNSKAVDILVTGEASRMYSIDVKAVQRNDAWMVKIEPPKNNHFLALVCFDGRILDLDIPPDVWMMSHETAMRLARPYDGASNLTRADVLNHRQSLQRWKREYFDENARR